MFCFLDWLFVEKKLRIFFDQNKSHLGALIVFCVVSASKTGLLLVVELSRNVVMMHAGAKVKHQVMRDAFKLLNKKTRST